MLSCPGIIQHIPTLSPTFNLALLLAWNAWYVHRHTQPLHPHIQSTMQAHAWTCTYGFPQQSGRPGTDSFRHSRIGFSQTSVAAQASGPCLHVWHCEQVVSTKHVTIWDFTSAYPTPELTQRPLLCVGWHRGIILRVWNIHAAQALMKIYVFLAPTFSAEEVFKWARHGAETE